MNPTVYVLNNRVTSLFVADVLSAIGVNPVMAVSSKEVVRVCSSAQGICINMGTPEKTMEKSYYLAAREAVKKGIPLVLDFPGLGLSAYRFKIKEKISKIVAKNPSLVTIRGNASEIINFFSKQLQGGGIDSLHSVKEAVQFVQKQKSPFGAICISGEVNYVRGSQSVSFPGASKMMTSVSGFGCVSSALIASFLSLREDEENAQEQFSYENGVAAVLALMKDASAHGPDSPQAFKNFFIDQIFRLKEASI